MLPEFLYRGDSDKNGSRHLKDTIDFGQFSTQLLCGGIGKDIFEIPFENLIHKHVGYGWNRTHFLSFTESENIAMRHGIGCKPNELMEKVANYVPYNGDGKNWDFAILKLDTGSLETKKLDAGIFEGTFATSLTKFSETGVYRILLIDVVTVLSNASDPDRFADSIENAEEDREWLLLPVVPIELNHGRVEFSGILDGCCIEYAKYSSEPNDFSGAFLD